MLSLAPHRSLFTLPKTLRVRAFAKINAGLKILRKRSDGYHELRTIYQTIGLHDRSENQPISQIPARPSRLNATTRRSPPGVGNLVYRTGERPGPQAREFGAVV